jgi:hypothetical protein
MIRLYDDKSAAAPATAAPKASGVIRLYNDAPAKLPAAPTVPPQTNVTANIRNVQSNIPSLPLPKGASKPIDKTVPAYGGSNITDQSGKQLLTLRNDEAQRSQLLSDRIYAGFDPTKPQKLDRKILVNGRMPESVSAPIKKQLGGVYSDELDHKIALELSGSNNPSNLKIEKGRKGGESAQHDQLENALSRRVSRGEISLLDAQRQLAKAKGYTLKEDMTPGQVDETASRPLIEGAPIKNQKNQGPNPDFTTAGNATFTDTKAYPGKPVDLLESAAKKFPSTADTLAHLEEDPLGTKQKGTFWSRFNDASNGVGKAVVEGISRADTTAKVFGTIIGKSLKNGTLPSKDDVANLIGSEISTATGFANIPFSVISSAIGMAEAAPGLYTVSKLANLPFNVIGDAGGALLSKTADFLPISDQAKEDLRPRLQELGSVIGQVIGGHRLLGEKGVKPEEAATLEKAYGHENATEIIQHDTPTEIKKAVAEAKTVPAESVSAPAVAKPTKIVQATEAPAQITVKGTGETKARGLSAGVEAKAIENRLTSGFADLPEYEKVNIKEQASQAHELMTKDYEQAKRIAMGTEAPPKDLLPESVFVAVEDRAIKEGDVNTLRDLATRSDLATQATTMGQRLRTLAERNPDSPVSAIREVAKAREKAATDRPKGRDLRTTRRETTNQIKSEIKKAAPTRETWSSFVESLKC